MTPQKQRFLHVWSNFYMDRGSKTSPEAALRFACVGGEGVQFLALLQSLPFSMEPF